MRSPRSNLPLTLITPAGRRLLPFPRAMSAPLSTITVPAGLRELEIQLFRAVFG